MTGPRRHTSSSSTAWMVTFSDLVVLMLAFFVLMFSMSSFKIEAFERLSASLTETFNPHRVVDDASDGPAVGVEGLVRPPGQGLGYLASVLETTFADDPRFAGTLVQWLDDRLVVLLPADLLFDPGQAAVAATARPVVAELGALLANLRNRIAVAGHTGPEAPGPDSPFANTWELSLARAAAVANGLRGAGYAAPLEVWGHADTRQGALAEVAESERARLARRVDIVILPDRPEGGAG
ncbi:OmpA/MotB family protein [Roseospira goensis]|uniref:Chemotaxis protein MotB n=1 Tax=Roseospira goensis TaxID=391922 RepID=A0A7W6S178_9PROT|nr:flagellar motor protein MotB [Roseospira goensis]MBB4287031.1 chemotaxis protein MotB [Roseospira goensis]